MISNQAKSYTFSVLFCHIAFMPLLNLFWSIIPWEILKHIKNIEFLCDKPIPRTSMYTFIYTSISFFLCLSFAQHRERKTLDSKAFIGHAIRPPLWHYWFECACYVTVAAWEKNVALRLCRCWFFFFLSSLIGVMRRKITPQNTFFPVICYHGIGGIYSLSLSLCVCVCVCVLCKRCWRVWNDAALSLSVWAIFFLTWHFQRHRIGGGHLNITFPCWYVVVAIVGVLNGIICCLSCAILFPFS